MRKALMGLIAAATVLTPAAALAQRGHRFENDSPGEHRAEHVQQRNEARQQRQEPRQAQPQPQPQQQQAAQSNRGGGSWRGNDGNRGGGGDNNRGGGNRSWRGNDGNNQGGNQGGDNRNWRGNGGNNQGGGNDNRGRERPPSIYPQTWQGDPNDPRLRRYQQRERENWDRGQANERRGDRNWRDDNRRDGNWRGNSRGGDWRNDGRGGDRRDWNRNWRSDNRYDWRGWRNRNRSTFRIGPYYSPYRNWGYNRFSIGIFLEPLFYSDRYWIGDPWQYRLPPAYPGTQWVRYYDDVLLVDVYSGEVLDVIYDFFW
ncbi:MAG TPA: RcnB family protein [Allosphingosinicella sp.]|nr:RcnB family protein [Allosphingosinicella sp.]